ncbi:MAG: saccharopine dehydrogenase NADP-binding domain-containing protein [Acidobacteria bacterium]|nr:saccharopine dehydrogenase NADP-binding domain-containing protein [Acidobacteriota bacterium]
MKILVLGAGRMGYGAAFDLVHNSTDVSHVTVADSDADRAAAVAESIGTDRISHRHLDASNYDAVAELMESHDAAISCVNYWYNESLSKAAIETVTHFCDLGGNNYVVDAQLALDAEAKAAGINIIPDCGLAPGMVSILAMHGAAKFDRLDELHIRVGGLPQKPEPPLDYQLVFSVEGLINEYIETARVIRNGELAVVESMTELESLSFDGFPPLEAFQTSGGTSTLPDTFLGKIKELDYKTIRYAGHCEKFKTMIDLGLCSSESMEFTGTGAASIPACESESEALATGSPATITPRKVFASLLEKHLPADGPDYVLVRLEFKGTSKTEDQKPKTLVYDIVDKQDEATGLSAMMRTTAFPASIIAQMMARGDVLSRGATPQEKAIDPEKFVAELKRRNIQISEYES